MRLRFVTTCAIVASLLSGTAGHAAESPRVVNVTSDSTPGWIPSVEQSADIDVAARDYWAARDQGKSEDAYGRLADINKQNLSFADYAAGLNDFNAKAGAVVERRIVKVTWTKDSPQAPLAGVYAALDVAGRFARADRYCGFLILYQPNSGGPFRVMREEDNVLDNESAAQIARDHGSAGVDQVWARLSSNCPNYPGFSTQH